MTEDEYQQRIQALGREMYERADTLIDYLVSQPPRRMARVEARAFGTWALEMGAEQAALVQERMRRKALKKS